MNETERHLMVEKLGEILHHAMVEIRNLSYRDGSARRINDLADLTHNLPRFMLGRDDHVLRYLRAGLLDYYRKYEPGIEPADGRYVRILDMDETSFHELYANQVGWLEPAEAGV